MFVFIITKKKYKSVGIVWSKERKKKSQEPSPIKTVVVLRCILYGLIGFT